MPLKVLPSITKPSADAVGAGAQVDVGEPALAAAAAPLDGQHDQVEGVHRLDLDPGGAATPGVVRRVHRLHDHALVAEGEGVPDEGRGDLGVVGADAGRAVPLGDQLGERRPPLGAGPVEQVGAVEVQQVEEVRRHLDAALHGGARRGLLEGPRPAVVGQGQRLAVEHEPLGREGSRHLDDLGQPVGDHVERAGRDDDVVAVPVDLDPDAVELGVDRDPSTAGLGHRRAHVGRAGGEHRQHRPADLEPDLVERGLALERRPGDRHRAAREHRGAAYGLAAARRSRPRAPSWTSASRAPWRTLPVITPRSQACSSAVARPNRSFTAVALVACEPAPDSPARCSNAPCTSATVRLGSSAGGGGEPMPRQPTPVRRWSSEPPR